MTVSRHNADQDNTLLTTPTALMLDTRLTPLERNGWQVLRMLRASDGTSSLASLGQLRRYLTSIPLGQKAGYETAWRVLVVLRLTGWISLVGQQRDPLTSNVLNERYQVHEHPHAFSQACEIDPDLPQLLHESAGHENNQVSRVATYIQATLAQAPADSDMEDDNDDAPPPASTIEPKTLAEETSPDMKSVSPPRVMQQNSTPRQETSDSAPTYSLYKYKKHTYRAGENETAPSLPLPPCLEGVKPRQQQDIQTALHRLPEQQRQDVLDELQDRSQSGGVRNVLAYFFGLIKRVLAGEFRFWAGRKLRQPESFPASVEPAATPQPRPEPTPAFKPAAPEVVKAHIAQMRSMLNRPTSVGELAAKLVQDKGWRPNPA
ncbi:STY4528 family pathogenicity island replication protein [Stutzerimonas kirkiae]|uniref:Uncharacterized protein n=1 Tax=Stutzerimonas kirkiae TaxID=2211392 RepID=A0A4Q9RBG7_9GAMM|nr:STY4528 family pathogenicity island replication protein [Stutzerimonas kirkiae]TBU98244.1 hypothetical protein DNJ96_05480 [Stutzerimonas kirkiae]TBV00918.1 hypothetical protein DNJ95_13350 [Stutzerimonas kirkiae]TBV07729.1 hypothetical protein DNK08_11905 [Stutzerimonas kirkiae]